MSCISKILELKGDKEFFYPGEPLDAGIEGGGIYSEYEYLITFVSSGHRCGYVGLPSDHPLNIEIDNSKYGWDIEGIHCHGGITFGARDHYFKELLKTPCNDNWIGFDCAHEGDGPDAESQIKYFPADSTMSVRHSFNYGSSKTFNYVEDECKSIIDQLIQMESANVL